MSPRTVREVWSSEFRAQTDRLLDAITDTTEADLFWRYAMPVSANALRSMTGLTNMSVEEMNRTSQGMIDGCANYTGDLEIEARCNDCTASIDKHITEKLSELKIQPDHSLISVQLCGRTY